MDRAISLEARRIDLSIELPFLLGRARIDPPAHESKIAGKAARIQPQNLKVLIALHDKSGEVVTRDELVDRCWDGRIVGDDVINRCISQLRRFAARSGGFRIETVPRAGYRLVESTHGRRPMDGWIAAAAALLVAALIILAWDSRSSIRQGIPPAPVMAVVPFTVESNDPVSRQIADAAPISISHMLSESGFATIVSNSRAGARPEGDFIISGNVRRLGGTFEVTVQLNRVRDGVIAFSHDFQSTVSQSADLPDQIGAALAAELAWTAAEMVLDRRHPLDAQLASGLMEATRLTIEDGDSLRAYQIARRIAAMAPSSAIAQLTLAVDTGFAIDALPRGDRFEAVTIGRQASVRARLLAPEFGDVYVTWCLLHSPVRMAECEARLHQAMRIDSSASFAPGALSTLFYNAGRIDEAVELARVSIANDPYKPAKMARMIRMLEASGSSDEAEQVYRQARRLWPESGRMSGGRLFGLAEGGNYQALARLAATETDGQVPDPPVLVSLAAASQQHDLGRARRACSVRGPDRLTLALCMTVLADLGDLDRSYGIAGQLFPGRKARTAEEEDRLWINQPDSFPTAILSGPAARSMRTDARFLALADRIGLLDYWRSARLPDFCTKAQEPVCARISARRA